METLIVEDDQKLCHVCNGLALMMCSGCDIMYCSNECLRLNWFVHRDRHVTKSVGKQLEVAMETDTPAQKASAMEIEELTMGMEELSAKPMSTNLIEIQNFFDRPMVCINKFRRPLLIPKNAKDANGFFSVVVTSIDLVDIQKNIVYSVHLASLKNELNSYKALLNATYENDSAIPLLNSAQDYAKLAKTLIMINNNGQWTRCIELSKTDEAIFVEDIDSGKKTSMNVGFSFKKPQKQELARNAFTFKVSLSNIIDRTAVDVGDSIKICLENTNLRGVSIAKVDLGSLVQEKSESENVEVKSNYTSNIQEDWIEEEEKVKDTRIMIQQIKVKNFPVGLQELTYMDGSKISAGKIHVCLASDENVIYQLFYDIQAYIEKNEGKNNYKPKLGEMVLARFAIDDNVYRAVCTSVSEVDCRVSYVEYGSDGILTFNDIWKLPNQFSVPCMSRSVIIKLASGKDLKTINILETVENLSNINHFKAIIECLPGNKYVATIDDDLVVFT